MIAQVIPINEALVSAEALERAELQIERALVVSERFADLLEMAEQRSDADLRQALQIALRVFLSDGTVGDALKAFRHAEWLLADSEPADTSPGLER